MLHWQITWEAIRYQTRSGKKLGVFFKKNYKLFKLRRSV